MLPISWEFNSESRLCCLRDLSPLSIKPSKYCNFPTSVEFSRNRHEWKSDTSNTTVTPATASAHLSPQYTCYCAYKWSLSRTHWWLIDEKTNKMCKIWGIISWTETSENRSSESPGTDVILLCFQWEAPTLTTEVSQSSLQDGLEKWRVNLIQRQSTTFTGNSVSYLTGININSACSFLMSFCTPQLWRNKYAPSHAPSHSILPPSLHLAVIVHLHGHSDKLVSKMSRPNSKLTS